MPNLKLVGENYERSLQERQERGLVVATECEDAVLSGRASGVVNCANRLIQHHEDEGRRQVISFPGPINKDFPFELSDATVTSTRYLTKGDFSVSLGSGVQNRTSLYRDDSVDVVHGLSLLGKHGIDSVRAAERLGLPVVLNFMTPVDEFMETYELKEGPYPGKSIIESSVKRLAIPALRDYTGWLYRKADKVLVPSNPMVDYLSTRYKIPEEKIVVAHRGVDTVDHNPFRKETEEVAQIKRELSPTGRPIIGLLCRAWPEKRPDWLKYIVDLDAEIVFMGDGPSLEALKKEFGHRVKFLGQKTGEEKNNILAAYDVYVHFGDKETLGQSLQEGSASGLPGVAPESMGAKDVFDHGKTGFLHDPDDPAQMVAHIKNLLNNPEMRKRFGWNGYTKMLDRTWESHNKKTDDALFEAIARRNEFNRWVVKQGLAAAA